MIEKLDKLPKDESTLITDEMLAACAAHIGVSVNGLAKLDLAGFEQLYRVYGSLHLDVSNMPELKAAALKRVILLYMPLHTITYHYTPLHTVTYCHIPLHTVIHHYTYR